MSSSIHDVLTPDWQATRVVSTICNTLPRSCGCHGPRPRQARVVLVVAFVSAGPDGGNGIPVVVVDAAAQPSDNGILLGLGPPSTCL
jgi:hypothetical protein